MGFGKVNPKAKAGGFSNGALPTWMVYQGVNHINNKINIDRPTNSSLYMGNNINLSGQVIDRNFVYWGGTDYTVDNTTYSLTGNASYNPTDSVLIVPGADANRYLTTQSVVIGSRARDGNTGNGSANTIIGYLANTSNGSNVSQTVVIGNSATTSSSGAISIGFSANTSSSGAIAIGQSSAASAANAIALGVSAAAGYSNCIAIGASTANSATNGISIGTSATTTASSISIGTSSYANSSTGSNIALGNGAGANATGSIGIGASATGTGNYAVSIGYSAGASGVSGIAIGYPASSTSNNAIAIGSNTKTDFVGEINICNAGFAAAGDIHTSNFPYYAYTTSASATELQTNNGSASTAPGQYIVLVNNATYAFTIDIVAQVTGGHSDCAMWTTQFLIQRGANAASTALVGTPSGLTAPLYATTGAISGSWAVAVTADTTNGRPAIKVTGQASTNISWVAHVKMTKVGY